MADGLLSRLEKERRRDEHAARAEELLTRGIHPDTPVHATLAAYYQALIEWEHGAGVDSAG